MKPFLLIFGPLTLLLTSTLLLTGCKKCDLTNARASARVVITSVTAPPGRPSHRFLEVTASGFHPNAQARLTIGDYPTLNGSERLEEPVTMDAQGALRWKKEPVTWLGVGASDPDADILITVSETNSGCFALTNIKRREFQKLQ